MLELTKTVTGTNELTLTQLKLWIKQTSTDDDVLLTSIISEAREMIENYLNISLVATTITATTSDYYLELPYSPIIEIYSVNERSGGTILGEALEYEFDGFYLTVTQVSTDTIVIKYKAGFTDVNNALMVAWKQVCSYLYQNRGDDFIYDYISRNIALQLLRKSNYIF